MKGLIDHGDNTAFLIISQAGSGTHTITYTYTNNSGVYFDNITKRVRVDSVANVDFDIDSAYCINSPVVRITGKNTGIGGTSTWNTSYGTTSNASYFDYYPAPPLQADSFYFISFQYFSSSNKHCPSNLVTKRTKINPLPVDSIAIDPIFNKLDSAQVIYGYNTYPEISFSASKGIVPSGSEYKFNPYGMAANSNILVTYNYTDTNGCSNSATKTFSILAAVGDITSNKTDFNFCYDSVALFTFNPSASYDSIYFNIDDSTYFTGSTSVTLPVSPLSATKSHAARFFYLKGHSWFEVAKEFGVDSVSAGWFKTTYPNNKPGYACKYDNDVRINILKAYPSNGTGHWYESNSLITNSLIYRYPFQQYYLVHIIFISTSFPNQAATKQRIQFLLLNLL